MYCCYITFIFTLHDHGDHCDVCTLIMNQTHDSEYLQFSGKILVTCCALLTVALYLDIDKINNHCKE